MTVEALLFSPEGGGEGVLLSSGEFALVSEGVNGIGDATGVDIEVKFELEASISAGAGTGATLEKLVCSGVAVGRSPSSGMGTMKSSEGTICPLSVVVILAGGAPGLL